MQLHYGTLIMIGSKISTWITFSSQSFFRYITILYYLNDVEEGGETAFPVADYQNFNESVSVVIPDPSFLTLHWFLPCMGSQQKESDPREREENDSRVDRGTFQGLLVKLCNIPSTSCEDLTIKFSDKRLKIDFIMTFIKKFKRRRFDATSRHYQVNKKC